MPTVNEVINQVRRRVKANNEFASSRGLPIDEWDENSKGSQWIYVMAIRSLNLVTCPYEPRTVEDWIKIVANWDNQTRQRFMLSIETF